MSRGLLSTVSSARLWAIVFFVLVLISSASAQDPQISSSSISSLAAGFTQVPLLSGPSNPIAGPGSSAPWVGGSSAVPISSEMFRKLMPKIPHLDVGFFYLFANNYRETLWTIDYLLPVALGPDDILFGELHADTSSYNTRTWVPFLDNFWQQTPPTGNARTDLALGIGYRRMLGNELLVGVNTFYDATRLFGTWRSSGSVGLEMVANGPGDLATDINFNYYSDVFLGFNSRGSVFPTFNIFDDIRGGKGSYDLEAGLSQPLFNRALDLRLKVASYQFDLGNQRKYGYKTGADLTTADGLVRVTAEYGHDGVSGSYGNVGGYLTVGFHAGNLLSGENPFSMPDPVFRSPRNIRKLLTSKVRRNWHKPSAVVANPKCEGLPDESLFKVPYGLACFYSGHPIADAQCSAVGRYTISDTPGQHWVVAYDKDWLGPPYDYDRDIQPIDKCMSAAFARMAEGDVVIYVKCGNDPVNKPNSVLWTTELPTLLNNPNVTSIKAYDNCGCPGGGWCHEVVYR